MPETQQPRPSFGGSLGFEEPARKSKGYNECYPPPRILNCGYGEDNYIYAGGTSSRRQVAVYLEVYEGDSFQDPNNQSE